VWKKHESVQRRILQDARQWSAHQDNHSDEPGNPRLPDPGARCFWVGKTSLVKRFVQSVFSEAYLSTVGVKIDKKTLGCPIAP
jgi:Ras family